MRLAALGMVAVLAISASVASAAEKKHVLLLAGRNSHAPGEHEHKAGVLLLAKCLEQGAANLVEVKSLLDAEWPSADQLKWADTILFYCDGGAGHFLLKDDHLAQVAEQIKRGCGFVCLHYGVEYPKEKGGPEALDWMGGYFEMNWSVNPHWTANFKELATHPVTSGVQPFSTNDEWYFHMRFASEGSGKLTKILSAVPPESTMSRPDGSHSGNPTVRDEVAKKVPQSVAWAFERPGGGRGFGFTGGHFHRGWGDENQRKLVLNAIVWTAGAEVPDQGIATKLTTEDLDANVRPKAPAARKAAAAKP